MSEENVILCIVVNVDSVSVEAPNNAVIHSRLQRLLACKCVVHCEQSYIQPNMLKSFLQCVFHTFLCKRFSIRDKTTMASIGD